MILLTCLPGFPCLYMQLEFSSHGRESLRIVAIRVSQLKLYMFHLNTLSIALMRLSAVLQWQAEHHKLLVGRIPSDPGISATTGLPTGLYGQRFHRTRGHTHAAVSELHSSVATRQQQQQEQQSRWAGVFDDIAEPGQVHLERQHTL